MSDIETETHFLFHTILNFIKLPFFLILVMLGQRDWNDRPRPFRELLHFLMQAQGTFWMCIALIFAFILQIALTIAGYDIDAYALFPTDLLDFRFTSFVTSMFLHADPGHLLGNLLFLLPTGRAIERAWGTGRFIFIYFAGGIISGIFSALGYLFVVGENIPSIGASGAIMGVAAAASLLAPFMITYEFAIPLPIIVLFWASILADISGALYPVDNVNHFAHLGGALSIIILAYFLSTEEKRTLKKGLVVNLVTIAAAFAIQYLLLT